MNEMSFHFAARERITPASDDRSATEAAWLVLEAANDLGDQATVAACRRVIDASLSGTAPASSDVHLVLDYFR
ncbi:hypothetical protein ACQR1W_19955 [Bradyrhizobium sp. HKCCYLS1011]|uniref:hypothetical protein n=1 Tax=Bradyrhizobium sp. HKCCYLS1011 TaxID=3420733 RepID=UPI003EB78428